MLKKLKPPRAFAHSPDLPTIWLREPIAAKLVQADDFSGPEGYMPRTCLACSSPAREAIDKALVAGEPFRNIAKRVSISPAGLLRHKNHVATAIVKAQAKHEECLGETLLDEMRRVQRKAWELLSWTESEGDHRGSIVALREVRECLESLGKMLAKADTASGGSAQDEHCDCSMLSDEELWALEALLAKATNRPAWKHEF